MVGGGLQADPGGRRGFPPSGGGQEHGVTPGPLWLALIDSFSTCIGYFGILGVGVGHA